VSRGSHHFRAPGRQPLGVKQRLWQYLLTQVAHDPALSIVDSCPIPVCQFARARRCRRLRKYAAYGKDELVRQTYDGLRLHLRICWPGMITDFNLVAANEPGCPLGGMPVAESDLLPGVQGWALADRGYWKTGTIRDLAAGGLSLLAPYTDKKRERGHWPHWLVGKRRRIETVLGQRVEHYRLKRVWARDAWHLWSRWLRCVLSHTIAVLLCQQQELSPLQFDHLLTD
jgi:Transposase DDE domain